MIKFRIFLLSFFLSLMLTMHFDNSMIADTTKSSPVTNPKAIANQDRLSVLNKRLVEVEKRSVFDSFDKNVLKSLAEAPFEDANGGSSLPERHHFLVDEKLKFRIEYLFITGGYANFEVSAHVEKPLLAFSLTAKTTPFISTIYRLNAQLRSVVRNESFKMLFFEEEKFEGNNYSYFRGQFYPDKKVFRYTTRFARVNKNLTEKNRPKSKWIPYQVEGFGILSYFYRVRTYPLEPNSIYETEVFYRDKKWKMKVEIFERSVIKTKYGRKAVVRVIPSFAFKTIFSNTSRIEIFFTDDKYHLPVKMQSRVYVGAFVAKLISGYPEEWK